MRRRSSWLISRSPPNPLRRCAWRRTAAAAALAALALPGCGAGHPATRTRAVAPAPAPARCPGLAAGDQRIDGTWVHVPARAPRRPALVLLFHGVSDRAEPFVRFTGLARLADRRRFVLAAPEMQPGRSTWQLNHR